MKRAQLICKVMIVLALCSPAMAQYSFYGPAENPQADCDNNGVVGPAYGSSGSYWHVTGGQINFSGATLFRNYFETGQSTNDWMDADGDCFWGYDPFGPPYADQLAEEGFWGSPSRLPYMIGDESPWMFQYRAVGSINGFKEFQTSQLCGQIPNDVPSEQGIVNRFPWSEDGERTFAGPHANCSGTPFTPCEICGSFMDVPSTWATQKGGDGGSCDVSGTPCMTDADCPGGEECVGGAAWFRKPCEAHYGANPGTSFTGYGQLLPPLEKQCEDKICAVAECFVGECADAGAAPCSTSDDCAEGVNCINVNEEGMCLCSDDCITGECIPAMRCSDNTELACTTDSDCIGTCELFGTLAACDNFEDCALGGEVCTGTGSFASASFNVNYDEPDALTIYDFTAAWLPIAIISNRGTDLENIRFSEMQYLWTTGRLPNGENLVASTRDAGSGTRNGAMNSIGIDPSWARGDNLGSKTNDDQTDLLGPIHQPTNKGGSSRMEGAVQNNRLAVGYTGLAGSSRAAKDAASGKYEILNVCKDVGDSPCDCCEANACSGDSTETEPGIWDSYPAPNDGFVRPEVQGGPGGMRNTILDNSDSCCGYQIAGSGSFTTLGNPDANRDSASYCTVGGVVPCPPTQMCENDGDCDAGESCVPADPFYNEFDPPVEADACAQFLNNMADSIRDFSDPATTCHLSGAPCSNDSDCEDVENDYCEQGFLMPGQKLALDFFLPGGVDSVHSFCDPLAYSTPAGGTNQFLQNYIRINNTLGWVGGHVPAYPSSSGLGGHLPKRLAVLCGDRYSDGQQEGYCNTPGDALPAQYAVHGDFDQSGARDLGDASPLVEAWNAPRAFYAANNIVPEILGDFNGDGSLTKEDLRYWADGLAMVPAEAPCPGGDNGWRLDRMAGAIAIDNALAAQGLPYPWADQDASIIIPPACGTCDEPTFEVPEAIENIFPARNPAAAPNVYEAGDFRADIGFAASGNSNPGGLPQADGRIDAMDLDYCCKMTAFNWADPTEALYMNLSCDMDGDLDVDGNDVDMMIVDILETERGDVNLDGIIDAADLAILNDTIYNDPNGCNATGSCGWADGDFDCDGDVDTDDRLFVAAAGDCNASGTVDLDDYKDCFAPCMSGPSGTLTSGCYGADVDVDGDVDLVDFAGFQVGLGS